MIVVNQRRGVETQSAVQQVARRGGPTKDDANSGESNKPEVGKDVE
jgi:hypothetical protein